MIAEFLIGRRSRANTAGAYRAGSGNPLALGGTNGCISRIPYFGLLLGSSGLDFGVYRRSCNQQFCRQVRRRVHFFLQRLCQQSRGPVIWLVVFLLATHFIIMKGVEKGIEKSAKIMMPMLFILLVVLAICSVSLPGAGAGIEFLLKPDFSKVDGNVFLGCNGTGILFTQPRYGMSLHIRFLFQK